MKKLLSCLITLFLLISCLFAAALPTSAEEVNINYDDFDIVDGVILEYLGTASEVIVPSIAADGSEITRIDERAFYGNTDINAVYICEGITEIGSQCFEGCVSLSEVSLPYSLVSLGDYATFRDTSVASLIIPGNCKEIPTAVVSTASAEKGGLGTSFTDLVISPGVEKVNYAALYFSGKEVVFPDTVYSISGAAWTYVNSDVSVYICNPDCEIGVLEGELSSHLPNSDVKYTYTNGNAPLALQWNNKNSVKVYASKDAETIKEAVNSWKQNGACGEGYIGGEFQFIGQTEDKMAEKQKWCEENGTVAATKWVMQTSEGGEPILTPNEENNNNNANNNNSQGSVQNGNNLTLILIIAVVALIVIIIVAVVIVLVAMNSKKKKKKKKKKAAASAVKEEPEAENTDGEGTQENK